MKIDTGSHHLRLVGKGWEIRAYLRRHSGRQLTLAQWLYRRQRALGHTPRLS